MSKRPLKYLKNEVIEDVTTRRIREYEAKVERHGPSAGAG